MEKSPCVPHCHVEQWSIRSSPTLNIYQKETWNLESGYATPSHLQQTLGGFFTSSLAHCVSKKKTFIHTHRGFIYYTQLVQSNLFSLHIMYLKPTIQITTSQKCQKNRSNCISEGTLVLAIKKGDESLYISLIYHSGLIYFHNIKDTAR